MYFQKNILSTPACAVPSEGICRCALSHLLITINKVMFISVCNEAVAFIHQVVGCCCNRYSWKFLGHFWYLQCHLQLPGPEMLRFFQGKLVQKGCFEMCDSVRSFVEQSLLCWDDIEPSTKWAMRTLDKNT